MRYAKYGIGSAAAIALLAGTAIAQQNQQYDQKPGQQMGQQYGAQEMQYRHSDQWRSAAFIPELSDTIVVLESKTDDQKATVHILHGQVQAKLDGEKLPSSRVQQKGEQLRIVGQNGETVAELSLPDLQTIRQARMMQRDQFGQQGLHEQHLGTQDQWQDTWRHAPQRGSQQQDDWRFRDQQRFQQDEWGQQPQRFPQRDTRFRDQQRDDLRSRDQRSGTHDDWRYHDERMMHERQFGGQDDWRFRDREPQIGDMRDDFGRDDRLHRNIEHQLGLAVSPATQRDLRQTNYNQGLIVEHVQPGSPLDMYGIRPGDLIVRVDGRTATRQHLQRTLTQVEPHDTVRMIVVRDGREGTFNLRGTEIARMHRTDRFDQRFDDQRFDQRFERDRRVLGAADTAYRQTPVIGVQMQEASRSELQRTASGMRYDSGIRITRVQSGSPADLAGLRSGDLIVEIDGRPNVTPDHLRQELSSSRPGDTLPLTIVRNNREGNINVRLTEDRRFGIGEDRFRDDRFNDDFRHDQRRFEQPSRQEHLFRLPGQVPPGPDAGIYQPRHDDRRMDRRNTRDSWDIHWDRNESERGRDW